MTDNVHLTSTGKDCKGVDLVGYSDGHVMTVTKLAAFILKKYSLAI